MDKKRVILVCLYWLFILLMLNMQRAFFFGGIGLNALLERFIFTYSLVVFSLFVKGLSPKHNSRFPDRPRLGFFFLLLCSAISICLIFASTAFAIYLLGHQFAGESYFVHSEMLDPFLAYTLSVAANALSCYLPMWCAGLRRRDLLCIIAFPVILQLAGGVYVYMKTDKLTKRYAAEFSVLVKNEMGGNADSRLKHITVVQNTEYDAIVTTYVKTKDDCYSEFFYFHQGMGGWTHVDTSLYVEDYRKYIPWPVFEFADMK